MQTPAVKIEAVIAANRFGLGARPDDLAGINDDHKGWLIRQVQEPAPVPAILQSLATTATILEEVQDEWQQKRAKKRADGDGTSVDAVKKTAPVARRYYLQQAEARLKLACATDAPFRERLVHFWANHFAVSADKKAVAAIAGSFENEAIRPNLNGSFLDLLLAVEKHPAMLLYLDNQRSAGPGSKLALRANRRSHKDQPLGLNENLAREILELHTLGVNGGYTQKDVTAFARVITGWSVGGMGERGKFSAGITGTFEFRENIHEPGAQTVLQQSYRQNGVDQGEAVMRDLSSHKATAYHLSTKLVRHFVSDEPPAGMVERIADVFVETNGNLPKVYAALVNSPEPWLTTSFKYKTPTDFVISAFRALGQVPKDGKRVVKALDMMGQTPFRSGSPAGWPDTAAHWGGADGLYKRIEWSAAAAKTVGSRVNPLQLAEAVLGAAMSEHTRKAISRAESSEQGLTLFLASPEFQRR